MKRPAAKQVLIAVALSVGVPTRASVPADQAGTALEAEVILYDYADCLVASTPTLVQKLVELPDGTAAKTAAQAEIVTSECLDQHNFEHIGDNVASMRLQQGVLPIALEGALYRRRFRKLPFETFADVPPLPQVADVPGMLEAFKVRARAYRALGDCAVRKDPASAHALVVFRPNVRKSQAVQASFVEAIRYCLTVDQSLTLNRFIIRQLAESSIYKLATAKIAMTEAILPKRNPR